MSLLDKVKKYRETKSRLETELDRSVSYQEIASEIKEIPEDDIRLMENLEIDEDEETDVELMFRINVVNMKLRKAREAKG